VRAAGGCYWELHVGPRGVPLETYLLDPPVLLGELVVPARGVVLIERNGVTHVVDRVGTEHYLNVADYIEESKRHGISRRLPSTLDFARLSGDSRLLLVHDRAWNDMIAAYSTWSCPKGLADHQPAQRPHMCLGVAWEDVDGGSPIDDRASIDNRCVRRTLPSVSYEARCRPDGVQPRYRPAFFLSVPCTQLALVGGTDQPTVLHNLRRARLPVMEVPV